MKEAVEHATAPGEPLESITVAAEHNDYTREVLEKEHHGILLTVEEVVDLGYHDFICWMKGIVPYGNFKNSVLFFNLGNDEPIDLNNVDQDPPSPRVKALFFTDEHSYAIHAQLRDGGGYLGAYAGTRKPRPGECWTRGNDLPDGKYCKKTFNNIVRAIVRYEMKRLQCWVK